VPGRLSSGAVTIRQAGGANHTDDSHFLFLVAPAKSGYQGQIRTTERHRDVIETEIARAETFLGLLEPAAQGLDDQAEESLGARRSGWALDALLPYLLRDWTNTPELEAVSGRIGTALERAFPDPSRTSVVVAACGAGGLLAGLPPGFERVLGLAAHLQGSAASFRCGTAASRPSST
jgi:hypothetical protein